MPLNTNMELRRQAREALKKNLPMALLVGLIAALPSLLAQVMGVVSGLINLPQQLLLQASNGRIETGVLEQLLAEHQSGLQLTATVTVISLLLSPVLGLGEVLFSLHMLRGEEARVTDVAARLPSFLKALGLAILTFLYLFLWELPGMALVIASSALMAVTGSVFWASLLYPGSILMLFLGARAALRVSQANVLLAEDPKKGILACLRESRKMMEGQLMRYLSLLLSFVGWYLGLYLLDYLLASMLGSVLGNTLSMLLQLALSVYMTFTATAFYLQRLRELSPHLEAEVA